MRKKRRGEKFLQLRKQWKQSETGEILIQS